MGTIKRKSRSKKPGLTLDHSEVKVSLPRLYSPEVKLIGGIKAETFVDKNPVVSRTIRMRGDQTLDTLHEAIFKAFNRFDDHLYEFQFGKKPMDRDARRYVIPMEDDFWLSDDPAAGFTDATTLDGLGLRLRERFFYWFDFGDNWWHAITVVEIDAGPARGKFPRVIAKVGKSPPQYCGEW